MELLQLRYFRAIAKYESVTLAAREFGIPQSAMSQTLARLEKDLGVQLFDRKNNRLHLNKSGKVFLAHVEQSLSELDVGIQMLSTPQDRIMGPIRLLVRENSRFVIQCVSKFAKQYPDVSFYICHDFYSDDDSEYNLCIAASPFYMQMKRSIPLIRERMILAVCDEHPLSGRKTIRLEELKDERFITQSTHSSLYNMTVDKCRLAGFDPRISISCDDPYFIRKYISENMGISIAPSISWAGRFRENTRLLEIVDPPLYSTSYLVWNEKKYQSPAVRAFRHFLKNESYLIEGNLIQSGQQETPSDPGRSGDV